MRSLAFALSLLAVGLGGLRGMGAIARADEPRAVLPAMVAIEAGPVVVYMPPDLRSVLAVDADGKRRWRVPIGDQGGIRDLDRLGPHVVAYAGTEALLLAADSGKILGRRPNVVLGTPGGARGCRVREEEGACAIDCECRFEVVSCDDLHALGAPALLPSFEEEVDGQRESHCPIFSGALVGRAGELVITRFPSATDKPFFAVPEVTLARDAHSGREVWRSSALGFFDAALSGVGRDGVCYAGERAGSVVVFDCQRGSVLWRRAATGRGAEPQVEASERGLFVRDGTRATLLGWRDGQPLWEVSVPVDRLVLLEPQAPDTGVDRRFGKAVGGARWLSLADGRTLGDVAFLPGADRWPRRGPAGWVGLAGARLEAWDPSGKSLGGFGTSASFADFVIGDGARVAAWDRHAVTLADLGADRPLATLDGPARVIAFDGAFGHGRVALLIDGKGPWKADDAATFGELRLYRVP